ncbi:hypothetical protein ZWY2020_000005 [Hordeum vulgare]|nr:hypothetical protein ZWY2020_000005 [Hordeum vulgare]
MPSCHGHHTLTAAVQTGAAPECSHAASICSLCDDRLPPAYYARLASFRARFYIEPDSSDSGSIMSALQSGSSTSRRRRGRQAPPYALGQLEESRVLLLMMMLESPVLLQNKKDSVLFAAGRIR